MAETRDPTRMELPHSERLRFRPLTENDVDNLLQIFGDPVAMEFWPGTQTRDEMVPRIKWAQDCYRELGYGLWAVELEVTGEFVGRVGLIPQQGIAGRDEVEVGYALVPRFWHQGLATEAAAACLDYAFEIVELPRVVALIRPENLPSRHVAERLGMRIERRIDWQGMPHDVHVSEAPRTPGRRTRRPTTQRHT